MFISISPLLRAYIYIYRASISAHRCIWCVHTASWLTPNSLFRQAAVEEARNEGTPEVAPFL